MNFNFPPKKGTGIQKLLPHASKESIELMFQLCTYDPDERISAKQALRHAYFKDLRSVKNDPVPRVLPGLCEGYLTKSRL